MPPTVSDQRTWLAVVELLADQVGLAFPPGRRDDVEAGIKRAMVRAGITDVAEYLDRLRTGGYGLDGLIDELTVGESYFFREVEHFEFVRREVLPGIRRLRGPGHALSVWSAGCAAGEEPYSVAILLDQEGVGPQANILATDVSRAALARARAATYTSWALRGLDPSVIPRYFRARGDHFVLDETIRRRVVFEHLNVVPEAYPVGRSVPAAFDLVLCRNVLIYLTPQMARRAAATLLGSLADGGWLLTGPSDPLLICEEAPYETVVTDSGVFYRRGRAEARASARAREERESTGIPTCRVERPAGASAAAHRAPVPGIPQRLAAARGALTAGHYRRAVDLAADLEDSADASVVQVRALANLSGAATAERACARAIARHPRSAELHLLEAVLLLELGRPRKAEAAARRAIALDRSLAMAHLVLASILRLEGDRAGARRAYRNVYDLCAVRPKDEVLPLSDGEPAGRLAEAVRAQLLRLESAEGGLP